ncbi:MAG: phosphoglucosamine mutase, partial [Chloroflexota bacterium]|nr:phosphoglucosamine mutase [Chloroflexota bacterium]
MGRRFGTDGIRGEVGSEISVDLALALGRAVGYRFGTAGESVLLGRDTRRSGEMLTAALAAGLTAAGADVIDLGVVTTPSLVHASRETGGAAIMVSASHNPAPDNGLKVVIAGRKADDDVENELERLLDDATEIRSLPNGAIGRMRPERGSLAAYERHLVEIASDAFRGLRLGIDCANGSASGIAPDLFRSLGA